MKPQLKECQEMLDKVCFLLTCQYVPQDKYIWPRIVEKIYWPAYLNVFLMNTGIAKEIAELNIHIAEGAKETDEKVWLRMEVELNGPFKCEINYEVKIERTKLDDLYFEMREWLEMISEY